MSCRRFKCVRSGAPLCLPLLQCIFMQQIFFRIRFYLFFFSSYSIICRFYSFGCLFVWLFFHLFNLNSGGDSVDGVSSNKFLLHVTVRARKWVSLYERMCVWGAWMSVEVSDYVKKSRCVLIEINQVSENWFFFLKLLSPCFITKGIVLLILKKTKNYKRKDNYKKKNFG